MEGEESLARALQIVNESGGIEQSRVLAREQADLALACLEPLTDGPAKQSLIQMVEYVLERLY